MGAKRAVVTHRTPEVPSDRKASPGEMAPRPMAVAALSPAPPAMTGRLRMPQRLASSGESSVATAEPSTSRGMACRDRLIEAGKEAYHLLELVYGVPAGSSPDISKKRFNRIKLKDTLLQEFWKEEPEEMKVDFIVNYTPEAQKIMAERMILDSDVIQTLEHMRETGEAVLEEDTGLLATRHRLGNVTFWVKYKQQDGGYLVHSAYSHRMEIVTR